MELLGEHALGSDSGGVPFPASPRLRLRYRYQIKGRLEVLTASGGYDIWASDSIRNGQKLSIRIILRLSTYMCPRSRVTVQIFPNWARRLMLSPGPFIADPILKYINFWQRVWDIRCVRSKFYSPFRNSCTFAVRG